ncbi:hypothetical protein BGZ54_006886 [Gamsiella multidivaricata]|nr:hypothetical protein BGZ54_006886 [Gamsiella multidivaricata]
MSSLKLSKPTENYQQPRNVFRRLSSMARVAIKRRSSVQVSPWGSPSTPQTPTTFSTPLSADSTESCDMSLITPTTTITTTATFDKVETSQSTATSPRVSLQISETIIQELPIADNDLANGAKATKSALSSSTLDGNTKQEKSLPAILGAASITTMEKTDSENKELATPIADTFLVPVSSSRQRRASKSSELNNESAGTLAVAMLVVSPSSEVTSSVSSVRSSKVPLFSAEKLNGGGMFASRPHVHPSSSLARRTFLAEREARKATLRIGTSMTIQAKAESLQSPTFPVKKASIENLRRASMPMTKGYKNNKPPPVKSLIGFWEQVSESLDD